jgi:site-specific DNA-methyltransferase (adenine-specific)
MVQTLISETFNEDCMIGMARYPDKYFDLAVVDPPYGIGENWKKNRFSKFYKQTSTYKNNSIPSAEYFKELFRISKHQIIWGANYYTAHLPARNSWIVWDKNRNYDDSHMAEAELAWTSFNVPVRLARFTWNGFIVCEPRYGAHPHEKPTSLYLWQYKNYLPQGGKVIDTHLGSGSNRIAANKAGNIDFYGWEIYKEYFEAQEKRYKQFTSQLRLW